MSLINFWHSDKENFEKKKVQQIVAIAGDGDLKDDSDTSKELRTFLAGVSTNKLAIYLNECLEKSFTDSGLVLQDIVNELGSRLDYDVIFGRYRGVKGSIGYDGIWKHHNEPSIVLEVKTTDAYTIDLETVATYRKKLIEEKEISDDASILFVVGRKDTGAIEAQVRGSKHAWDIRIISADALLKLVNIKEDSDSSVTIEKLRSILRPNELTKVDFIVDLLETATDDIKSADEEMEAPVNQINQTQIKEQKKEYAPAEANFEVAKNVQEYLAISLKKKTRTVFISPDHDTAVCCLISKTYEAGRKSNYWYAFHPRQQVQLEKYTKAYIAFGCGTPNKILLFDYQIFQTWLKDMNTTDRQSGMYWHVQFFEDEKGNIEIALKANVENIDVTNYRIL